MTSPARQTLIKDTGRVTREDSKTVKIHPFDVPPGIDALALRFDYSPRKALDKEKNAALVEAALKKHNVRRQAELTAAQLEDQRERIGAYNMYRALNNLMNVTLIDPTGQWRGRWDRNPSSDNGDLVLTRKESSPGFLPGELTPGRWQAAVECHGVFGDPVSYELEVAARGPLEPAEREGLMVPEPSRTAVKRRSGPGWYFGETHSHTINSDGVHQLPELARRVAAKGADFLCLTDHNTTSGLMDPGELPLTLIAGCELTTFHGHHPIFGLKDIVPWHKDGRVIPMEEMAKTIRAKGGIVGVAHPFKIGDPVCTGCRMRDDLAPEHFDTIEVWYREWIAAETDNLTSYALWNSYWANGHRITALAARDWHGPGQEGAFPGEAPFSGVWATDNTPEAILEGIRKGRVIMSGGPILDFSLRAANGQSARVGETLKAGAASIVVEASKLDAKVDLRIFKNGTRLESVANVKDGHHAFEGLADGPGWYRVEAWAGAQPRVITNHAVLASP